MALTKPQRNMLRNKTLCASAHVGTRNALVSRGYYVRDQEPGTDPRWVRTPKGDDALDALDVSEDLPT